MVKTGVGRRLSQLALCGFIALVVAASATDFFKPHKSQAVRPPVISGSPQTAAKVGQWYSFTPSASGPSGYTLRFAIAEKPSWASFNARTGQLAGTPTLASVGTHANIVISVSDGLASAALRPFAITVSNPSNGVLGISGQPLTSVNMQWAYSFTPTVTDSRGGRLTFSIQNRPSWATFNSASGQLSGTPAAGDVGTYSNVIISVADGVGSASLAPFTIAVNQISSGSASLSWMPPTRSTSGLALTNLAGYHIYYGTDASSLSHSITVATIGLTNYTIGNLAPATWYFRMSSYTTGGVESALTSLVSKTVP